MAEKVKVSREVAEIIVNEKEQGKSLFMIMEHSYTCGGAFVDKLCGIDDVTIAKIYIGDYEIEQTPEEKILATYQRQFTQCDANDICDKRVRTAYSNAILYTLDTLGIKIEGINK